MYFVYVLVSVKHAKSYVGLTNNIQRRLLEHNSSYHVYTKRYKPWKVLHIESFVGRIDAREREKYLKSSAGRRWMKIYVFSPDGETGRRASFRS